MGAMTKSLIPSLLLTGVMYAMVKSVGYFASAFEPIWLLLTQIAVGVAVYFLGALICRFEALRELVSTIKGVLKR